MKRYFILEFLGESGDPQQWAEYEREKMREYGWVEGLDYRIITGNEEDPLDGTFASNYAKGKQLWLFNTLWQELEAKTFAGCDQTMTPDVATTLLVVRTEGPKQMTTRRCSQLIDALKDAIKELGA